MTGDGGFECPIPVSWYQQYSEYFRVLLVISVRLGEGKGAEQQDCEVVQEGYTDGMKPGERVPPRFARELVTGHLNRLLSAAGVRPVLQTL